MSRSNLDVARGHRHLGSRNIDDRRTHVNTYSAFVVVEATRLADIDSRARICSGSLATGDIPALAVILLHLRIFPIGGESGRGVWLARVGRCAKGKRDQGKAGNNGHGELHDCTRGALSIDGCIY